MGRKKSTSEIVQEVKETIKSPVEKRIVEPITKVVSTGSTLLDLAISGKRIRGGGIPAGKIVEVFGPPSQGKTAILAETCASTQLKGGDVFFLDPEARLDQEYARIYGVTLNKENYAQPDTVTQVFDIIETWKPKNTDVINIVATDSLAALSTKRELEKEDKMGMLRAREFSQGLRKTCRLIKKNNFVILCSNQMRENEWGEVTPGGKGIPFYASVRIRVGKPTQGKFIEKEIEIGEKENSKKLKKIIGIKSFCEVKKNSVDEPFRTCDIYIIYQYGIDNIRGNLQYMKDMTQNTLYNAVDREFKSMSDAVRYIEENDLQMQLKEMVIDLWEEIEQKFIVNRKLKIR